MNDALPEVASLPSGAKLQLQHAPFSVSMKLLQGLARVLQSVTLGIKMELNFADPAAALARLAGQDLPLDLLKNAVLQVLASTALESLLAECMGRCLYNGVVIQKDTFEPVDARGDYFPVAWEVMKHNLLPFFRGLGLKSSSGKNPAGGSRP